MVIGIFGLPGTLRVASSMTIFMSWYSGILLTSFAPSRSACADEVFVGVRIKIILPRVEHNEGLLLWLTHDPPGLLSQVRRITLSRTTAILSCTRTRTPRAWRSACSSLEAAGQSPPGHAGRRSPFDATTKELVITGANLRTVNGLGRTDCGSEEEPIPDCPNGLGNLIVGYNEPRTPTTEDPEHPHRLAQRGRRATEHSFSRFGGIGGRRATTRLAETSPSVSGGFRNTASGFSAAVSGGVLNTASGFGASDQRRAEFNTASAEQAWPSAAESDNTASGGGAVRQRGTRQHSQRHRRVGQRRRRQHSQRRLRVGQRRRRQHGQRSLGRRQRRRRQHGQRRSCHRQRRRAQDCRGQLRVGQRGSL